MKKTGLYHDDIALIHFAGDNHPEKALRLKSIIKEMRSTFPDDDSANNSYIWMDTPVGTKEHILLAHDLAYWQHLKAVDSSLSREDPPANLDEDTYLSYGSLNSVRSAVGGVCQAVNDVLSQRITNGFVVSRPPGHHARRDAAMGFCVFNNIAIAAKYALTQPNINRVAIVDFDVHHGNGTEDIVQDDPNILFFSLHQEDIWPYLHHTDQGPHGTINNLGMPPLCDPALWHDAFDHVVIPKIDIFEPDFIFISAGFDAHKDDPPAEQLFNDAPGRQNLVEADFDLMTKKILDAAYRHCHGRVVSLLEGGYNPDVLASCAVSHAKTLIKADHA